VKFDTKSLIVNSMIPTFSVNNFVFMKLGSDSFPSFFALN
jgi:hypothetical protein